MASSVFSSRSPEPVGAGAGTFLPSLPPPAARHLHPHLSFPISRCTLSSCLISALSFFLSFLQSFGAIPGGAGEWAGAIPGSVLEMSWSLFRILSAEGSQVPHMQGMDLLAHKPASQLLFPFISPQPQNLLHSTDPTAHLLDGQPDGPGRLVPWVRAAGVAGAEKRWRAWHSCPGQALRSKAEDSWLLT